MLAEAADAADRITAIQAEIAQAMATLAAGDPGPDIVKSTMDRVAALRDEEAQLIAVVAQYREMQAAAAVGAPAAVGMSEADLRLLQAQAVAGGGSGGRDLLTPVSTKDFPVGAGAGAGRKPATFEDIIGPARERLALLRDTELSEDRISEIISAQGRLKRDLSDAEREALIEVNGALDAEEELRQKAEERVEASEGLTTTLREQQEEAQLLLSFSGEETDEYKLQLALLQAQRTAMGELSAENRQRVLDLQKQTQELEQQQRTRDLQQRTRQLEFEGDPMRAMQAGVSDITGLPARREFYAEQERFRLRQEDPGMTALEEANLEPMIQQLAAAEQHLVLMTETAPQLAATLTDLTQIAISEGFEEAGVQFLAMLSEMILQALILQAIMAAIGMISGSPTGAGGVGGMGLVTIGGVRQHGGPVRKDQPYLVGEAGPELFVPTTGGEVLSNPDTTRMLASGTTSLGAAGGGREAPTVVVNVQNNAPNTEARAEEQPGGGEGGGPRIDVMIDEMVAGNLRPGTATSRAMRDRFGLSFTTRR